MNQSALRITTISAIGLLAIHCGGGGSGGGSGVVIPTSAVLTQVNGVYGFYEGSSFCTTTNNFCGNGGTAVATLGSSGTGVSFVWTLPIPPITSGGGSGGGSGKAPKMSSSGGGGHSFSGGHSSGGGGRSSGGGHSGGGGRSGRDGYRPRWPPRRVSPAFDEAEYFTDEGIGGGAGRSG